MKDFESLLRYAYMVYQRTSNPPPHPCNGSPIHIKLNDKKCLQKLCITHIISTPKHKIEGRSAFRMREEDMKPEEGHFRPFSGIFGANSLFKDTLPFEGKGMYNPSLLDARLLLFLKK